MKLYWLSLICILWVTKALALEVTDYAGRTVSLIKPAKRVVALAPHIVENLFSAGAGDVIVGTVDYSDYPETAKKITNHSVANDWAGEIQHKLCLLKWQVSVC